MKKRCLWSFSKLMLAYHDKEWGTPLHQDRKLFEFLILDIFQAGLNWSIILHKRRDFKKAFDEFNVKKIAQYKEDKVDELLKNPKIIRNRLKIQSTIINARQFIKIQKKYKTFDKYIWNFVKGKPIVNCHESPYEIPTNSLESDEMSIQLKKDGFKFIGSKICYAFMQSTGMVNDHLTSCFRYKELQNKTEF